MRQCHVVSWESGLYSICWDPYKSSWSGSSTASGLYDSTKTETVAEVLGELGVKRAMVVSSLDGLDEISISAPTQISELLDGQVRTFKVTPEEMGLARYPISEVMGGNAQENASIIQSIFSGEQRGAYRDIVLANAGACIYVGGLADNLADGAAMAAEVIDSGKAEQQLRSLILTTGELTHVSG